MASTGAGTFVSRIQPFSGAFAQTGSKGSSTYYKYIKVGKDAVTKKDYEAAKYLDEGVKIFRNLGILNN